MALFGLGQQKPHHYREMVRIVWENRDQLPFAWRILTRGVCDGCALGTTGVRDWTLPGTHLCMVRLELLRLNTAPALDPAAVADVSTLAGRSSADLRALSQADLYATLRSWLSEHRGNKRGLQLKHIQAIERLVLSEKSGKTAELPGGKVIKSGGRLVYEENKVEN